MEITKELYWISYINFFSSLVREREHGKCAQPTPAQESPELLNVVTWKEEAVFGYHAVIRSSILLALAKTSSDYQSKKINK